MYYVSSIKPLQRIFIKKSASGYSHRPWSAKRDFSSARRRFEEEEEDPSLAGRPRCESRSRFRVLPSSLHIGDETC